MDEHKSDPCDSLCEKIQELLKEVNDLRQDVRADKVWNRMSRELDCHTLNVREFEAHGIEMDDLLDCKFDS